LHDIEEQSGIQSFALHSGHNEPHSISSKHPYSPHPKSFRQLLQLHSGKENREQHVVQVGHLGSEGAVHSQVQQQHVIDEKYSLNQAVNLDQHDGSFGSALHANFSIIPDQHDRSSASQSQSQSQSFSLRTSIQ
jgi:hypothetical protein